MRLKSLTVLIGAKRAAPNLNGSIGQPAMIGTQIKETGTRALDMEAIRPLKAIMKAKVMSVDQDNLKAFLTTLDKGEVPNFGAEEGTLNTKGVLDLGSQDHQIRGESLAQEHCLFWIVLLQGQHA